MKTWLVSIIGEADKIITQKWDSEQVVVDSNGNLLFISFPERLYTVSKIISKNHWVTVEEELS